MKTQANVYHQQFPSPSHEDYQYHVQAIQASYRKQLYTFRAEAINKCKKANNKAVAELQRIHQQYQDQVTFLQTIAAKMIEKITQKYYTIEIACDTSRDHLKALSEKTKVLLIHYRMPTLAQQDVPALTISKNIDTSHTFESEQTQVEQYYETLQDLRLPKFFVAIRPFIHFMVTLCPIALILAFIYGYDRSDRSPLYLIIPTAALICLCAMGWGTYLLWQDTKRDTQAVYGNILESLARAYAILQQQIQEAKQHLDKMLDNIQHTQKMDLHNLQQAIIMACSHIRARRDATFRDIGKKLLMIEKDLRDKRDQALRQACQEYQRGNTSLEHE